MIVNQYPQNSPLRCANPRRVVDKCYDPTIENPPSTWESLKPKISKAFLEAQCWHALGRDDEKTLAQIFSSAYLRKATMLG